MSNVVKGPGGREKVHEEKVEDVVVEVWIKRSRNKGKSDRVYFDFTLNQEYSYDDDYPKLGEYVQQRYLNAAMEALLKAQKWVFNNKGRYYAN